MRLIVSIVLISFLIESCNKDNGPMSEKNPIPKDTTEKDPTPRDSIVDLKYTIPVSADFLWNKKFRLVKSLTEGLNGRTINYEIGNDCKSDDTVEFTAGGKIIYDDHGWKCRDSSLIVMKYEFIEPGLIYFLDTITFLKSPEQRIYRADEKYFYLNYTIPRSQIYNYYLRVE